MWMRGGTSKGGHFLESDLPAAGPERDRFLLRIKGSPDRRQINGIKLTLIDNGMPCVIITASDLDVTGQETCDGTVFT